MPNNFFEEKTPDAEIFPLSIEFSSEEINRLNRWLTKCCSRSASITPLE